jgi:hypothetical protein
MAQWRLTMAHWRLTMAIGGSLWHSEGSPWRPRGSQCCRGGSPWRRGLTIMAITIDFPSLKLLRYHKKFNRFMCRYHELASVLEDDQKM